MNNLAPEHVLVLYENSRRGAAAIRQATAIAPTNARLTVVTVAVIESGDAKCCDTRAGYWNGVVRELAGKDLDRARALIGSRRTAVFKVLTGLSVLAALTLEPNSLEPTWSSSRRAEGSIRGSERAGRGGCSAVQLMRSSSPLLLWSEDRMTASLTTALHTGSG